MAVEHMASRTLKRPRASLEDLEHVLSGLDRTESEQTIAANLAGLSQLSRPNVFPPLLERMLDDGPLLAKIASRSYRHVNHFDKIVLIDTGEEQGYRLTLHLWHPPYTEQELEDELIHDHRFSFWSHVLAGDLVSHNFTVGDAGTEYRRYQYVPQKTHVATNANFYSFLGGMTLQKAEPLVQPSGSTYFLSYDQIHRVLLPRTTTTCTLVLRGPRRRDHSNVYNTAYPGTDVTMSNRMFTPAELAAKIGIVIAAARSAAAPQAQSA